MIRIVIVDEKESEQKLMQTALALHSDFEVVGYGKDGFDALTLIGELKPDIMIMDTLPRGVNGREIIPLLKCKSPHTAFLVFTSFTEEAHLSKVLNLGITAYLLKEADMDTLPLAIRTLHKGGHFFSPNVHDKVFNTLLDMIKTKDASAKASPFATVAKPHSPKTMNVKFSAIELRMIAMVVQGYSSEEIAELLCMSGGTVRNYLSAMLQKTGQRNRTQLAVFAVNNELLGSHCN